ncbi:hypothetical protein [Nocardia bovistercoris]|nr:hypothetical protein [Nocardia bovistercoris]
MTGRAAAAQSRCAAVTDPGGNMPTSRTAKISTEQAHDIGVEA